MCCSAFMVSVQWALGSAYSLEPAFILSHPTGSIHIYRGMRASEAELWSVDCLHRLNSAHDSVSPLSPVPADLRTGRMRFVKAQAQAVAGLRGRLDVAGPVPTAACNLRNLARWKLRSDEPPFCVFRDHCPTTPVSADYLCTFVAILCEARLQKGCWCHWDGICICGICVYVWLCGIGICVWHYAAPFVIFGNWYDWHVFGNAAVDRSSWC